MRRALKSKVQKIAYASMFVAAFSMATPTPTLAAIAANTDASNTVVSEVVEAPEASTEVKETSAVEETAVASTEEVVETEKKESEEEPRLLTEEELKAQSDRCTGIFFGSETTTSGDTFIGRSEDLNGNNRKDFHYVPAAEHDPEKDFFQDFDSHTDFKYPMPKKTVGYTAVHDDPSAWDISEEDVKNGAYYFSYAANGINDNGVAVTATTTTYMNEAASAVDPLIDNNGLSEAALGDVILSQAENPRHACEVVGKIINEKGAGEGYQFYAGNGKETWMFSTLSCHEWIAFRIPNDKVMINPNIGGLQYKVDLNDPETCIHSEKMLSLAVDNGFAKYYEDGTFNPFSTYGNYKGGTGNNGGVNSRLWQGYNYLTGSAEKADALVEEHPLFFTPEKKFDTFEVLRMLGYTGSGTKFDADQAISGWMGAWGDSVPQDQLIRPAYGRNESGATVYPIGNMNQLQTHVFQVRQNEKLPEGLRIVEWMSMGPATYGVLLPYYGGLLTDTPAIFGRGSNDHANQGAQAVDADAEKSIYWVMADYNKLVAQLVNKGADMSSVKAYRDGMQKDLIRQQQEFEAAMLQLDPSQWTAAANKMTEAFSTELFTRTVELNKQLRDYLAAGDFTKPFVVENTAPLGADKALLENGAFKPGVLPLIPLRTLNYDYEPEKLNIITGDGSTYTKGDITSVRINYSPETLGWVYVDDVLVDPANYEVKEGSTIVTFVKSFSDKFTVGNHTFKAVYKDGPVAYASFEVKSPYVPIVVDPNKIVAPAVDNKVTPAVDNKVTPAVDNKDDNQTTKVETKVVEKKKAAEQKAAQQKAAEQKTPATADTASIAAVAVLAVAGLATVAIAKRNEQ